jgi:BlaI family penicillinase repressor
MAQKKKSQLSGLESAVMDVVWAKGLVTSEAVRIELEKTQQLKDSTVRTILRRLEEKGYVEHDVDGRTYVYRPRVESQHVATDAVRGIIDRFCGGSVENLLVGMVDGKMLSPGKLKQLANKIADAEANEKKKGKS